MTTELDTLLKQAEDPWPVFLQVVEAICIEQGWSIEYQSVDDDLVTIFAYRRAGQLEADEANSKQLSFADMQRLTWEELLESDLGESDENHYKHDVQDS